MPATQMSPNRRAFNHYLRTGRRLPPEVFIVGLKGNPYHDLKNGQFTFGPGGPLRRPSADMMKEATNTALSSIRSKATTRNLTSEFSQINSLPNFSKEGWTSVPSTHSASSYEYALPDLPGMAVKVYVGNSNFGGANTATITASTYSLEHVIEYPMFEMGMPVNSRNAALYIKVKNGY